MILHTLILKWKERWVHPRPREIEAQTRRVSTKLSPAYSKRETRRLHHCHELFKQGRAGL